ncbi:MAG: response regulator transcription factor [Anaerolineaceae bacterium]|nr:response regulator transcription factor [Anaerolineaceae bacterium]
MNEPVALIVEDDAKLADIFSSAVNAAGFVTVVAENGRIALDLLQNQTPVLIVLDLHLPGVSGSEVLTFIKQEAHLQNAIVMLATADAWLAESLRAEVDFVLMKPISFAQLRDLTGRLRPSTTI